MIVSACSSFFFNRSFSRWSRSFSFFNGVSSDGLRPRFPGSNAPENLRLHASTVVAYKPSRRRITPIPPLGARSISSTMLRLYSVVYGRLFGLSPSSVLPSPSMASFVLFIRVYTPSA